MKFSIIYEAQIADLTRENEAKMFHDMVEQSLYAEQQGFDTIWAVEHTSLTQYAHMSTPETFLAFIAGATKRIHLGHGVVCLPHAMNHPIKVAERIAMLDILSKGRLHFGVGKGGTEQEAGAFGTTLEEAHLQVEESMYMIPKMWHEGEFSFESDVTGLKIPPRPIYPKPYSDPHPPMYLACTREDSLLVAGARGLGALVLAFGGPDEVAHKNLIYREAYANRKNEDQVGDFATEHLAALCPAIVLDDAAEALRIGLRGQRFFVDSLAHWYHGGDKPTITLQIEELEKEVATHLGEDKIDSSSTTTNHAFGSVDHAIAYVQRLLDAGADEILFLFQMGTVPHEAIMESIKNIGEQVIPHFCDR